MAGPRVFISSTFYDLKHIRSSLEQFVEDMGYEPILSEKGDIAYDPDKPLDESCYREAANADIFVLIIGGRYGSQTSDEEKKTSEDFFERYRSITKSEYEAAVREDIPTYILVNRSVYTEYETFKKNRKKENIEYAQVDSVNVFLLLDDILGQIRNNPVQQFDSHTEITDWLRNQWGGLFKKMLSDRSGQKKLASLTSEVEGLAEINTTLKTYLEAVMKNVPEPEAIKLIETEEERLVEAERMQRFAKHPYIRELTDVYGCRIEDVRDIYSKPKTLTELTELLCQIYPQRNAKILENIWRNSEAHVKLINEAREILGLGPLDFKNKEK